MGEGMLAPTGAPPSPPSLAPPSPGPGPGGFTLAQVPADVAGRLLTSDKGRFALQQSGLVSQDAFNDRQREAEALERYKDFYTQAGEAMKRGDFMAMTSYHEAANRALLDTKKYREQGMTGLKENAKTFERLKDKKDEKDGWAEDGAALAKGLADYNRTEATDPDGAFTRFMEVLGSRKTDAGKKIALEYQSAIGKSLIQLGQKRREMEPITAVLAAMSTDIASAPPGQTVTMAEAAARASRTLDPQVMARFHGAMLSKDKQPAWYLEAWGLKDVPKDIPNEARMLLLNEVNPTTGQPWRAIDPGFPQQWSRRVTALTQERNPKRFEGRDETGTALRDEARGTRSDRSDLRLRIDGLKRDLRDAQKSDSAATVTEIADLKAKIKTSEAELADLDKDVRDITNRQRGARGEAPRAPKAEADKPRTPEMARQRIKQLTRELAPAEYRNKDLKDLPPAVRERVRQQIRERLLSEGYPTEFK